MLGANPVFELHHFTAIFELICSKLHRVLAEIFSGKSVQASPTYTTANFSFWN